MYSMSQQAGEFFFLQNHCHCSENSTRLRGLTRENSCRMDFGVHKTLLDCIFQKVGPSSTVIMVTHHLQDLTMFDRVLVVTEGVVAEIPADQWIELLVSATGVSE